MEGEVRGWTIKYKGSARTRKIVTMEYYLEGYESVSLSPKFERYLGLRSSSHPISSTMLSANSCPSMSLAEINVRMEKDGYRATMGCPLIDSLCLCPAIQQ